MVWGAAEHEAASCPLNEGFLQRIILSLLFNTPHIPPDHPNSGQNISLTPHLIFTALWLVYHSFKLVLRSFKLASAHFGLFSFPIANIILFLTLFSIDYIMNENLSQSNTSKGLPSIPWAANDSALVCHLIGLVEEYENHKVIVGKGKKEVCIHICIIYVKTMTLLPELKWWEQTQSL